MIKGYLSSDKKLKITHTLNASSSLISKGLLERFFLAQRVQHILLNSTLSKFPWTWNEEIDKKINMHKQHRIRQSEFYKVSHTKSTDEMLVCKKCQVPKRALSQPSLTSCMGSTKEFLPAKSNPTSNFWSSSCEGGYAAFCASCSTSALASKPSS